jgi:hypothetical protein
MRHASPLLVVAAATLCLPARAAEVPPGKERMTLSRVPGKLGPVEFRHADHAARYRRPDGSAIRCRDCHHNLEADDPAPPWPELRCSACHAGLGSPERVIDGKRARVLATLKPDGAIDHRSILFHDSCRGCHLKTRRGDFHLGGCRVCHSRGIGSDVIHGRYDSIGPPDGGPPWLRCPAGQAWNGARCEGSALRVPRPAAAGSCPEGYRLPRSEQLAALAPCARSAACAQMFGADDGLYWADGEATPPVSLLDGKARPEAREAGVRCVQATP